MKLGTRLLKHAFESAIAVSEYVGVFAVEVDALNPEVKNFYLKHGFLELPDTPLKLFLPMARIKEAYEQKKLRSTD